MKILMVSTGADGTPRMSGGADSALLRPGEPLFAGEPAEAWCLSVAPAVRISKLGLHIAPRFAPRHYDAFGVVALHQPLADDGIPPLFHDRAVSPGKWIEAAVLGDRITIAASRRPLPGRTSTPLDAAAETDLATLGVDATVAWLSEAMTLKTGDIIIFAYAAISLGSPVTDTLLTASLNSLDSLEIRIK